MNSTSSLNLSRSGSHLPSHILVINGRGILWISIISASAFNLSRSGTQQALHILLTNENEIVLLSSMKSIRVSNSEKSETGYQLYILSTKKDGIFLSSIALSDLIYELEFCLATERVQFISVSKYFFAMYHWKGENHWAIIWSSYSSWSFTSDPKNNDSNHLLLISSIIPLASSTTASILCLDFIAYL